MAVMSAVTPGRACYPASAGPAAPRSSTILELLVACRPGRNGAEPLISGPLDLPEESRSRNVDGGRWHVVWRERPRALRRQHVTAQPADRIPASGPDTGSYEVIHLGGQAAVVVPRSDFLRLQALEQAASVQELQDAEDKAALADRRARKAAGQTS
jgi:hypothetical protein